MHQHKPLIICEANVVANTGTCYTIPNYIVAERFLCGIGLLFTLRHCNPVCAMKRKSLRFVVGMKNNLVCVVLENARCNQQIWYTLVQ